MHRTAKKVFYGSLYILILIFFIWSVYNGLFVPVPTCSDGVKNGNEEGIDCGGNCALSCKVLALTPLRTDTTPRMFTTASGFVVLVGTVVNPHADFAAENVRYEFHIINSQGVIVERITDTISLSASERRDVVAMHVKTSLQNITRTTFILGKPTWRLAQEVVRAPLTFSQKIDTTVEGSRIYVRGTLRNEGAIRASRIHILATLYNRFHEPLFIAETTIPDLEVDEESSFLVPFPPDETLVRESDITITEVRVWSQ